MGAVIDFGPMQQLTYPSNHPAAVYVITEGGLGSVGILFAEQEGTVITFTFSAPLCVGTTSYFSDAAVTSAWVSDNATLFGYGSPPIGRLQSAALS